MSDERGKVIEQARSSALLDAAFLIYRFNTRRNVLRTVPNIDPSEVWKEIDGPLYADAQRRASALYAEGVNIGAAFHRYPGAKPFEQSMEELRVNRPGFSEQSYGMVVMDGAEDMR